MQSLLLVIELLIAIALIGVVLLQRSEGGALGIGGGGGGLGGLFSPRGAADTLSRTTAILAIAFFVVNIALSQMVRYAHRETSPLDSAPVAAKIVSPGKTAPAKAPGNPSAPQVPTRH